MSRIGKGCEYQVAGANVLSMIILAPLSLDNFCYIPEV